MSPQTTDERYLQAIFQLTGYGEAATTGAIARWLGIAPASVSARLTRLERQGLLRRDPDHLTLTESGETVARRVVRRHRLIETFLHRALGVPLHELHAEAEALQDGVSERLAGRMDEALGRPDIDPHGDPIPRSGDGAGFEEAWPEPLGEAPLGGWFTVTRIFDRDPDAVAYLASLGLTPGASCFVSERGPFGGPLWVEIDGVRHALGDELTSYVHGVPGSRQRESR